MTKTIVYNSVAIILAMQFQGIAVAEQHANEAINHANEAAKSVGDAKAVEEHSTQALKHIEAAKAQAKSPEALKRLEKSESDLNSAVEQARRYNTNSAAKDAADASKHLKNIDK